MHQDFSNRDSDALNVITLFRFFFFFLKKTIKSFLPSMKARNHGHIVTIASAAGHFGSPKMTDYCASKFANMGLVESLMYELRAEGVSGVHLTTVCPYVIDTGMFSGCKSR